jgi:hypothetical protein
VVDAEAAAEKSIGGALGAKEAVVGGIACTDGGTGKDMPEYG